MRYNYFDRDPYRIVASISLALAMLPLFLNVYPTGHDITLLGDLAQLYLEAWRAHNLYPTTWAPLFGDREILVFHSSLAPIVASIEWIFPGTMLATLKTISCLGFFLYNASVFALLRVLTDRRDTSLLLVWAIICLVAPVPLRFMGSGGGVFVFSLGLMIFSIACLLKAMRTNSILLSIAGGLLLFNSSLVHPIPGAFAPFFGLACFAGIFDTYKPKDMGRLAKIIAIYGVCALPAVFLLRPPTSNVEALVNDWMHYVQDNYSSLPVLSTITNRFSGLVWETLRFPGFILKQMGAVVVLLAMLSGLPVIRTPQRRWLIIAGIFAFFIWTAHHIPIVGLGLYPDRGTSLVFILLGVGAIGAFHFESGTPRRKFMPLLLSVSATFGVSRYTWSYLLQPQKLTTLAPSDIEVIRQIPHILTPETVIATNYFDAGVWIPALTGYLVTTPHVHFALDESWKDKSKTLPKPAYKFQGAKCSEGETCPTVCGPNDQGVLASGQTTLCKNSLQ